MSAFLTIAIPTMHRWTFLQQNLPLFLSRAEVAEIIICDETGDDARHIENDPILSKNKRLRVIINDKRLGIYENKRKAASLATSPWIAVLDSDNSFPDLWFEELAEAIQKNKDTKRMFGSACYKMIDQRTGQVYQPCLQYDGLQLNKNNWNDFIGQPKWNFLLNDGNWVIPKEAVHELPLFEKIPNAYEKGATFCDAIYSLRCFIQAGYTIHYVKGMEYLHMVHSGSSWLTNERPSTIAFNTTNWYL